ncbi:MAG: hypothetical protein ACR2Q3_18325 [Woeseiaceae bacterium]
MKILLTFLAILALFGCTSENTEEVSETVGKQIADDYNAAMDKARNVENELLEQKRNIDDALQDAENASPNP